MVTPVSTLSLKQPERLFYYKYCSFRKLQRELTVSELENLELVLGKVPTQDFRYQVIDYRSEYLEANQYPGPPRWHYDIAPNPAPGPPSVHYLVVSTQTGSLTEFKDLGKIQSDTLYTYDYLASHRCSKAVASGHRILIRVSYSDHMPPQNRIVHNEPRYKTIRSRGFTS